MNLSHCEHVERLSGELYWGKAMPRDVLRHKLTSAVLGTMLGTLLIIAGSAGTALAADDDGEGFYDQRLLRSFLRGLGLQNGREGAIEYKERPPLVVPPSRDLPPPETTGSIAQRDPSWPSDPDDAKRRAAKKARAERKSLGDADTWGDGVKPNDLKGRTNAAPNETAVKPGQTVETSTQLRPDELGYHGGLWSDFTSLGSTFAREKPAEGAKFLREPSRASLTEPPSGYRTPSPDQPYGLNYRHDKSKPLTQEDRQTKGGDQQ
jgi:hypothetical protein